MNLSPRRARRPLGGFTLVELLVVIAIIIILAGILLPMLSKVRVESQRKADKVSIQTLVTALGQYELRYQDYPPSTLAGVGVKSANQINQGIEVVVATLSSRRTGSPFYEFKDDMLCNTDEDKASAPLAEITGGFATPDLFEMKDGFQNPLVYVHHRDYAKPGDASKYRDFDGLESLIVPAKSEVTKEWQGPGTYQIWGWGPNSKNENGGGDDVTSW